MRGNVFYYATLLPVCCIIMFNFAIFIPIMKSIQNHITIKSKFQSKEFFGRRIRITFSCSLLLGLTWVFGLFAVGDLRLPFQWIFAVLNSLQGLFIFIFHTVKNVEVQRYWRLAISMSKYRNSTTSKQTVSSTNVSRSSTQMNHHLHLNQISRWEWRSFLARRRWQNYIRQKIYQSKYKLTTTLWKTPDHPDHSLLYVILLCVWGPRPGGAKPGPKSASLCGGRISVTSQGNFLIRYKT